MMTFPQPHADLPAFHNLMKELLLFMQIPPVLHDESDVYSFTIEDKTEVNFLSMQTGSLDVLAEAGNLKNLKADSVLCKLLALNRFYREGPNLSIGMDDKTGLITVWGRFSLQKTDVHLAVQLIKSVLARVEEVQRCLKEKTSFIRTGALQQRSLRISLEQLNGKQ